MIRLGAGQYFGQVVGVYASGPFRITATRYRPGECLPRHSHEQPYLLVFLRGSIRENSLGRDCECSRGWLVYNEAAEPHHDQVLDQGAEALNIELDLDWLARYHDSRKSREPIVYRHAGPSIAAVGALQLAFLTYDDLQPLGMEEAITSLLDSLYPFRDHRCRHTRWLDNVASALRADGIHKPALATVAAEAGVHPAHLCREFRRKFGCTMTQYLQRLRADNALSQLLAGKSPLADVAARTGFADQAHLTRTIRRYFGTTPGKLRRG